MASIREHPVAALVGVILLLVLLSAFAVFAAGSGTGGGVTH